MKKILVFVSVAGKATRMYPISLEIPKHKLPINGIPLEKHIAKEALGLPMDKYDVSVYKNTGDPPKGTAYSLCKIPYVNTYDFVVVWYGDIYSEVNLEEMIKYHENKNSDLTFLSKKVIGIEKKKGLFDLNRENKILKFQKGNYSKEILLNGQSQNLYKEFKNPYRDVGILIISRKTIDHILEQEAPKGKEYDLSTHLFPGVVQKFNCYGYTPKVYTQDIGTMETYLEVICHAQGLDYDKIKREYDNNKMST